MIAAWLGKIIIRPRRLTPTGGDCSSTFAITTDHGNHAKYQYMQTKWLVVYAITCSCIHCRLSQHAEDNCEFIGILNCANQRWVCIINHYLQSSEGEGFTIAMRTGDVPSNAKEFIATLLRYTAHTVYFVSYQDVQQQTDRSICTLCEGNDPSRVT